MSRLTSFRACARAATAVEYGLILALVFLAIAGAVSQVADRHQNTLNTVSNETKKVL